MNDFKEVASSAEHLFHDATRAANREYAVTRHNIKGALDEAMARLDDAGRSVKRTAVDAADATDGLVRRNPWQALGIVAAAGLLAGYLLRGR
ncbi:MAG: DUF883 family protein [Burkholderiaceae bacterium]|nr:DUF883 family protein [Burkholderiaceae bacterium]